MSDRDQRVLATAAAVGADAETLDSPSVPEGLGRVLAERLRDFAPDIVAFWVSPDAAVLAHVTARELGVPVIAAREDQGRIILGRSPATGEKVVAVDVDWADSSGLLPLIRTFAGAGATVVAAASVLRPSAADEAAGVPLFVLETTADGTTTGGAA
jgi:adenine/guanine phosphoribosyltransferase-like PRPP-binding protein